MRCSYKLKKEDFIKWRMTRFYCPRKLVYEDNQDLFKPKYEKSSMASPSPDIKFDRLNPTGTKYNETKRCINYLTQKYPRDLMRNTLLNEPMEKKVEYSFGLIKSNNMGKSKYGTLGNNERSTQRNLIINKADEIKGVHQLENWKAFDIKKLNIEKMNRRIADELREKAEQEIELIDNDKAGIKPRKGLLEEVRNREIQKKMQNQTNDDIYIDGCGDSTNRIFNKTFNATKEVIMKRNSRTAEALKKERQKINDLLNASKVEQQSMASSQERRVKTIRDYRGKCLVGIRSNSIDYHSTNLNVGTGRRADNIDSYINKSSCYKFPDISQVDTQN